jgi:hypothetical protein
MHVHATGMQGPMSLIRMANVGTRYTGYAEPGYISGTQRERILYIPNDKLPGDTGAYPQGIFQGESIQRHEFGILNKTMHTLLVGHGSRTVMQYYQQTSSTTNSI